MRTEFVTSRQDGTLIVGASNGKDDYILWQRSEHERDHIYFEFRDQFNSGYNIVEECTIDNDGCHIVLNNGDMVHFYWQPPRHTNLEDFVSELTSLYGENASMIDDSRSTE
ncbi:MAG: hypothetical protein JXM70_23290 [Pirellulales bacterium]|nr:hypothetical protein [Pirellulales bacterium]